MGCGGSMNETPTKMGKLKKAKSLRLTKNYVSSTFGDVQRRYITLGDKDYFVILNAQGSKIIIYDASTKGLIKEVRYSNNPPNGVKNIQGLHVHNFDSIFIYSSTEVALVNIQGEIYHKFNTSYLRFTNKEGKLYPFDERRTINITYGPKPVFKDGKLYLQQNYQGDPSNPKIYSRPFTPYLVLDSKKDTIYSSPKISFPASMHDKVWKPIIFTCFPEGNTQVEAVVSLSAYENLLAIGTDGKVYETPAVSELATTPPVSVSDFNDHEERLKMILSSTFYDELLYDKWRNVYYRIAYPSREFKKSMLRERVSELNRPFSIILMDSDFKFISETEFEGGRYNPGNIFVGKEGLYLSDGPDYENESEDYIYLDCFSPEVK
jgi:hypothetical protein